MRETHAWKQSVVLNSGTKIEITQERSRGKMIAIGHDALFPGGRRDRHVLTFDYQGQTCQWEGAGMPFLLNDYKGNLYLAVVKVAIGDEEYPSGPDDYTMFVWSSPLMQWKRIGRAEFPRQIALQNLNTWYRTLNDGISEMIFRHPGVTENKQNPMANYGTWAFQRSVTAKFWLFLETDEADWIWWAKAELVFLDAFRKKWIDKR